VTVLSTYSNFVLPVVLTRLAADNWHVERLHVENFDGIHLYVVNVVVTGLQTET